MSNHDNISRVNDVIPRTVNNDNDDITEFNLKLNRNDSEDISITKTGINDSFNTVFSKLNNINLSDGSCGDDKGAHPKTIYFLKSTLTTAIGEEILKMC